MSAFGSMADYIGFTSDGEPCVDLSDCTAEQLAALAEVTVEDFTDRRGEDARQVRRIRIKPYDRNRALMDLAKLMGYVTEMLCLNCCSKSR